jgi:nicotinamidase-related amidase
MNTVEEVAGALTPHELLHIVKETRSSFQGNKNLRGYLEDRHIDEVHLVGTETHDCVLATAYDAFAAGYPVYSLEECCESGTPGRHEDGLKLLRYQSMTNNSCRSATIEVPVNLEQAVKCP